MSPAPLHPALALPPASHGLLHVGHVLEVLPAVYSAAPDSAAAGPSGGGDAGAPRLPFGPRQQGELRGALEGALLGCPRPLEALGGRLPAELVAALEARQQALRQGHVSRDRGVCGHLLQAARMAAVNHDMPLTAITEAYLPQVWLPASQQRATTHRTLDY